jgi:hypothetical protein
MQIEIVMYLLYVIFNVWKFNIKEVNSFEISFKFYLFCYFWPFDSVTFVTLSYKKPKINIDCYILLFMFYQYLIIPWHYRYLCCDWTPRLLRHIYSFPEWCHCIKRSPFSSPVIEKFIWIEPLLRGHLSLKNTYALSQRWPLNTGLTVLVILSIVL